MTKIKAKRLFLIICLGASSLVFANFTEVTTQAGLDMPFVREGAAWGDYDNDGCVDLAVSGYSGVQLYHNSCNGSFSSVNASSGVSGPRPSFGIAWADYDNDGDLDLYVGAYYPRFFETTNSLYQNNGDETFTHVGAAAGVNDSSETNGVSWGDYDSDGYLDLFLANQSSSDKLYHNNGNGTFTDVAPVLGIDGGGSRSTQTAAWFDYDKNGTLDLYLAVHSGDDVLYKNNGDGSFTNITVSAGLGEPQSSYGVSIGDIQGDGCLDILVTIDAEGDNTRGNTRSMLYANRCDGSGTFTSLSSIVGIEDSDTRDYGANFVDYDNDGDQDVSIVSGNVINDGEPNALYENNNGFLTNVTDELDAQNKGNARGAVWVDYDNDGDLDWFIVNRYGPGGATGHSALLRNDGIVGNHIKIALNGTVSNSYGVGARVEVNAGGKIQNRIIQAGSSYASAKEMNAFFGLDQTEVISQILVYWPSGLVDQMTGVEVNQVVTITEGSNAVIFGTLFGTITDPSDGAVNKAKVVMTNLETDAEILQKTDSNGQFLLELTPGTYEIKVIKRGFIIMAAETIIIAEETNVLDFQLDLK